MLNEFTSCFSEAAAPTALPGARPGQKAIRCSSRESYRITNSGGLMSRSPLRPFAGETVAATVQMAGGSCRPEFKETT